jgi:vancomycin resistance protein YoaR
MQTPCLLAIVPPVWYNLITAKFMRFYSECVGSVMSDSPSARPRWGLWLLVLLCFELFALAGVGGLALYESRYAGRIYEGVQVAGIPLGGMTLDEATAAIAAGLTPYPGPAITLRYADRMWSLAAADLGVAVDALATAGAAYAVGRQGMLNSAPLRYLPADLVTQWGALELGRTVRPILRYDDNRLAYTLKRIAQEIDLPPREARLVISGVDVQSADGSAGRQVDLEATRAQIAGILRAGRGGTVELVVEERPPSVSSVGEAAAKATALLREPLMLNVEGLDGLQRFAVDRAALRNMLVFSVTRRPEGTADLAVEFDREQITTYLQQIASQLDRPAYDAALDFDPETKQVIVLKPSQIGQELDVEGSADAVEAALAGDQREISLPIAILSPKVDSNKIAEMGIVELVSEGTTYFKGSSRDRVHNIANAAEKFRGVVIPPDEEFSFNKYVGDVTTANGFVEGLIIGAERTAVGIGGGVCQVSTTAFRAAFWGGFPITERHAHGYVVSWYEPPRGLDATIFTPSVDFRFLNDTGHFLLVKPEVDTTAGRVTFYLYGTKPDRTVEMDDPVITNVQKPPSPLYEEDPTLPEGRIVQVDWAKDGQDVVVKRRITNGDGTVEEQKFTSRYRPWQAVFNYGPGTELPGSASGG